jgi:hypothetical protein
MSIPVRLPETESRLPVNRMGSRSASRASTDRRSHPVRRPSRTTRRVTIQRFGPVEHLGPRRAVDSPAHLVQFDAPAPRRHARRDKTAEVQTHPKLLGTQPYPQTIVGHGHRHRSGNDGEG